MRYQTKAEWAAAKARQLRDEALQARARRVTSDDWRGVRSKMALLDSLGRDAARFEAMADRFRARGV